MVRNFVLRPDSVEQWLHNWKCFKLYRPADVQWELNVTKWLETLKLSTQVKKVKTRPEHSQSAVVHEKMVLHFFLLKTQGGKEDNPLWYNCWYVWSNYSNEHFKQRSSTTKDIVTSGGQHQATTHSRGSGYVELYIAFLIRMSGG
jgi:hypothetical protein